MGTARVVVMRPAPTPGFVIAVLLTLISVISIIVAVLILYGARQRGESAVLIVIPGFPLESVALGMMIGVCMLVMIRQGRRS